MIHLNEVLLQLFINFLIKNDLVVLLNAFFMPNQYSCEEFTNKDLENLKSEKSTRLLNKIFRLLI